MKKTIYLIFLVALMAGIMPKTSLAAAGIFPSGGGKHNVGETFTINVTASGGEFNAFQGKISVSGPVSVTSFSAGNANWITQPSNGGTFSGALLGQKSNSLAIATIRLKGIGTGDGSVTVSGVVLKNGTETISNSGGTASFSIQKAPELPGKVSVSSTTHSDEAQAYEATTVTLSWKKDGGIDGFSYLLDQAESTTPPAKVTDANITATYTDKAIGIYFFHIRAHKPDGWGPVTHFKITIKEPDAKINIDLSKPSNIKVEKLSSYVNDIEKGTFSGFKIIGMTEPNFTANLAFDPALTLPEGKTLSSKADTNGAFEILIDFPIKAGRYALTAQGQSEKILTPISDPIYFEISQARGGTINLLTDIDTKEPLIKDQNTHKKWYERVNYQIMSIVLLALLLISIALLIVMGIKGRGFKRLAKDLRGIDLR